ncbi:MAG: anthranilate phosphoribosyltransferase [Paludibacteraceae bacterium]|nr:anthranilate phosphoribosyltransferase [Paludibacteraceae bacterium]
MKQILNNLFNYESLSRADATEILTKIAAGEYNNEQIASFITVYLMRPITLEELMGFREALLKLALKIDLNEFNPIDIVGTGGDGKNTFNISTLSCFVLAGAGYKVAKHGNYGATSVSGASNVLEYYGAKFTTDETVIKRAIDQSGVAFLHAPLFNPAMKNVAPVRKALQVRTFFNVLGPLISPAQPKHQLLGVYSLTMLRLYTYINQHIGTNYTLVHSLDGYDEVSLTANSKIISNNREIVISPEEMGYNRLEHEQLSGGNSIDDAASIFKNVLENKATEAQTAVVIANSALAIQTLCPDYSLDECKGIAIESIESGGAKDAFEKFLEIYK